MSPRPSLDRLIKLQESGAIRPGDAALQFTGKKNRRSTFYVACWLRHLELARKRRAARVTRKA